MTLIKYFFAFIILMLQSPYYFAQEWTDFGFDNTSNVSCMEVDTINGIFYAGGAFVAPGLSDNIARKIGTQWSSVGSGMDDVVFSLKMYNGDLYAGGYFTEAGGVPTDFIAMWDGVSWSSVGTGTDGAIFDLEVFNGELYAVGNFTDAGGVTANGIAKWNGTTWSSVGGGLNSFGLTLKAYNGILYVGGWFTSAGSVNANYIAAWNGSSWSALGQGTNSSVNALEIHEGNLFLGGQFTQAGNLNISYVAKWDGSNYSVLDIGVDDMVTCMVSYNCELYVGGYFYNAGGISVNGIAKFSTITNGWSTIGEGLIINGGVECLIKHDTVLYASGVLQSIYGFGSIQSWNNSVTSPPTSSFTASEEIIQFGNKIIFTENGLNGNAYKWIFPGGIPNISFEKNPRILYPAVGVFDVSLITVNCLGVDTLHLSNFITVDSLIHSIPSGVSADLLTINTPVNTTFAWGDYLINYYKPSTYDPATSPILLYIHGQGGTGAGSGLEDIAERQQALIVAPTMHGVWAYVRETAIDSVTGCWHYIWLTEVMKQIYQHVIYREQRSSMDCYLTGFSEGGQFTTRYMLVRQFSPDSIPIKMAVSVSPSNYTLMTDTFNNVVMPWMHYKCGLAGNEVLISGCSQDLILPVNQFICPEHIIQYYNENYGVLVGTNDIFQFASFCGYAQGTDRYDRAKVFHAFSTSDAIARGTVLNWPFDSVVNVGHANNVMYNTKLAPTDSFSIAENLLFNTPFHTVPQLTPSCLTGINENDIIENAVSIYPNPANESFTVQYGTAFKKGKFILFDALGNKIIVKNLPHNSTSLVVNSNDVSNGIYYYNTYSEFGLIRSGKIVVIK